MSAMNNVTEYITETSASSFEQDVVQQSHHHLVLVDFWAAWCGPCQALTPILENLLHEYSGQVRLVKVNTDEQQELATRFGIRSLPTVLLFRDGAPVDQFMGVQPQSVIKNLLERHIVRESDKALQRAIALFDAGETDAAIALLKDTIAEDPRNDQPKLTLAGWLLDQAQYDEAKTIMDSVSREGKDRMDFRTLHARLDFGTNAGAEQNTEDLLRAVAADANNLEARFKLAQQLVQEKRLAEALDQLIEIIKRDKKFGDDAPRRTILKIFDLVGGEGTLVSRYRSLLAQALN